MSEFDVFLSYNNKDSSQVKVIFDELKRRNLRPWLDEKNIYAGGRFQEYIQRAVLQTKLAGVIIIGTHGLGKWQKLEADTFISQHVERKINVIPILLPGVDEIPNDLLLLKQFSQVSFNNINDRNAFDKLEQGITASEPSPGEKIGSKFRHKVVQVQYSDFIEDLGNDIKLEMVFVPSGKFMMGSPEGEGKKNEKPQHEVTVRPFYMSKYPITEEQYQKIMDKNYFYFNPSKKPARRVSWNDAIEFCNILSEILGRRYFLPSEAEWEYACRAGTNTSYYFGETITHRQANFGKNVGQPTSVGQYSPNAFGLYDMHGNVWEWCQDNWHKNYIGAPNNSNAWISGESNKKVRRGGSWDSYPNNSYSAYRSHSPCDDCYSNVGFRVVCVVSRI